MKSELKPLQEKLSRHWCETFSVVEDGRGGLAVSSAFVFDDGDSLPVHIDYDRSAGRWIMTDRGRLTALLDHAPELTLTDRMIERITGMVEAVGAQYENYLITTELLSPPDAFDVADFLQLLGAVNGLALRRPAAAQPNFRTIVRDQVLEWLPEPVQRKTNWYDELTDPGGGFTVDLRIWRPDGMPVDTFYVANREPIEHTIGTVQHLDRHSEPSAKVIVHRSLTDSPLMYRLQQTARLTGGVLVPVRGTPTRAVALLALRRQLRSLDVPLLA